MGQGLTVSAADLPMLQGSKASDTPTSADGDSPGLLRKSGDGTRRKIEEISLLEHIWRKAAVRTFCQSSYGSGREIASPLACMGRVSDPLASTPTSLAGNLPKIRQSPERKRQEYLRRLGIQSVSHDRGRAEGKRVLVGEHQSGIRANRPEPTTFDEVKQGLDFVSPTGPTGASDFRRSFLSKLSYQKAWMPKPHRIPMHSTLIIFDWDDTLLCTSFLCASKQIRSGPSVAGRFSGVAQAARSMLALAKSLGETIIITNAVPSWVQQSARKYLPDLVPEMQGIEIISARQRYERDFPSNIPEWKAQTFLDIQRRNPEAITNFVSVGDSSYEMNAALALGELFPQTVVKTVKFSERPTPEELERELQLLCGRLQRIVETGHDLRVTLERKPFPNTYLNWQADC